MSNLVLMENLELIQLYDLALESYKLGISAHWRLSIPDIDDAIALSYERDEIYDIVEEFHERGLLYDKEKLATLDEEWRGWLMKCIVEGDVINPIYPMPEEPKEKWWFHIETLKPTNDSRI